MLQPVESLHIKITYKIDNLKNMAIFLNHNNESQLINNDITSCDNDYKKISICAINNCYISNSDQNKILGNFHIKLSKKNIFNRLRAIYENITYNIKKQSRMCKDDIFKFKKYEKAYNNITYHNKVIQNNINICPKCGGQTHPYPQHSEMRCVSCNYILELEGTILDESQLKSSQETNIKGGNYETSRHCKQHLDRILGLKHVDITPKLDNKIKRWFRMNNIKYVKTMGYKDWRTCLKDQKITEYNKSIPYLMSWYGNSDLVVCHFDEYQTVCTLFNLVVISYDEIKSDDEVNIKYYPFFIAKLIEIVLKDKPKRKRAILNNIHFQESETVEYNDKIWKKICDNVNELKDKFTKTDKNLMYRI